MERKTTQRIIGILVMMALVIILMPLLLDKNEATTQTASIKAPPFPDQPVAANNTALETKKAAESIVITPDIANKLNQATTMAAAQPAPAKPVVAAGAQPAPAKPVVAAATPQQQQADDAQAPQFQPVATTPINSEPTSSPDSVQTTMTTAPSSTTSAPAPKFAMISTPTTAPNVIPVESKPAMVQTPNPSVHHKVKLAKATHVKKNPLHHVINTAATKHITNADSVVSVSKLAWAIQMGSFKNKTNAIHLADRLRTAGYKAFMHEVKSPKGSVQTRVYIGPEYKQASAAKLSMQLEQKLKLHGYIVPYKPLEL